MVSSGHLKSWESIVFPPDPLQDQNLVAAWDVTLDEQGGPVV